MLKRIELIMIIVLELNSLMLEGFGKNGNTIAHLDTIEDWD